MPKSRVKREATESQPKRAITVNQHPIEGDAKSVAAFLMFPTSSESLRKWRKAATLIRAIDAFCMKTNLSQDGNADGLVDESKAGARTRKELEEEQKKYKNAPWLRGRLALSEQAARYELPVDLLSLETMTPEQYLRSYTRIATKRQQIYTKVFNNNKNKNHVINFSELDKAIGEVLISSFDKTKHLPMMMETTKIKETTKIDLQLFSAMCALAERLLYPSFVTEDTENLPEFKRDHLELADFQHLSWKLAGINVNPNMLKLLEKINQKPLRILGTGLNYNFTYSRAAYGNQAAQQNEDESANQTAQAADQGDNEDKEDDDDEDS